MPELLPSAFTHETSSAPGAPDVNAIVCPSGDHELLAHVAARISGVNPLPSSPVARGSTGVMAASLANEDFRRSGRAAMVTEASVYLAGGTISAASMRIRAVRFGRPRRAEPTTTT